MLTTDELDFQQVHDAFRPRLLRYLTRLVGPAEAEDLAQEVFLRANLSLDTFRGEAQLSTWLYRIASNAAIDRLRSASFRQGKEELELDEQCDCSAGGTGGGGVAVIPVEDILLQKDRFHCFLGFIERLPLNYKIIVLLSEVEELTTREIAVVLGLSQETVKIRLHRGRTRLFQALREKCKPEEWL
jgi:RNA polymerase sigma-70 factor (ECF subfamily)